MIKITGLTKTYPSGAKAVDNLNLAVEAGEILALLGPNGAGKTTTIRVLTTLSGFDDGEVTVAGFNTDRDPDAVRRSIGYVAQETGVDYFLTGRENLVLQGRLYRMKKADIDARIEELGNYFSLAEHLDQLVSSYSGGMRRKLDIATALIHRPRVLFLDEPTLGLDTQSRQSLWQYIRKLNSELNLTILLTTHYLEEADRLSHRVAIIANGQIKITGTAEALKDAIQGDAVIIEFEHNDDTSHWLAQKLRAEDYARDLAWENDKLRLYVSNGAAAVPRVMEKATAAGVKVKNIAFARPTLDDVFIKYTGSSIQATKEASGGAWWEKWAGKGGGKWAKKWQEAEPNTVEQATSVATAAAATTTDAAQEIPPNQQQTWPSDGQWAKSSETVSQPEETKPGEKAGDATATAWPSDQWDPESVKQWQSQWPENGGGWPKDGGWQESPTTAGETAAVAPEQLAAHGQAAAPIQPTAPEQAKSDTPAWPSDQWDPESVTKWQGQPSQQGGEWPKKK